MSTEKVAVSVEKVIVTFAENAELVEKTEKLQAMKDCGALSAAAFKDAARTIPHVARIFNGIQAAMNILGAARGSKGLNAEDIASQRVYAESLEVFESDAVLYFGDSFSKFGYPVSTIRIMGETIVKGNPPTKVQKIKEEKEEITITLK